jgi:hypothetical protein
MVAAVTVAPPAVRPDRTETFMDRASEPRANFAAGELTRFRHDPGEQARAGVVELGLM